MLEGVISALLVKLLETVAPGVASKLHDSTKRKAVAWRLKRYHQKRVKEEAPQIPLRLPVVEILSACQDREEVHIKWRNTSNDPEIGYTIWASTKHTYWRCLSWHANIDETGSWCSETVNPRNFLTDKDKENDRDVVISFVVVPVPPQAKGAANKFLPLDFPRARRVSLLYRTN